MPLEKQIIQNTLDLIKNIELRSYRKGELSPLQIRTMVFIKDKGCVKSSDLARQFNVTPATITAQIDKLVNNGWLERCDDGNDRRVINITLTAKAQEEVDALVEKTIKKYNWVFQSLTKEEQKQFLSLVIKINQNAHKGELDS
ncbi:MAG: MarR family transcriptional regulator [Candidatus Dojkabacteria bacterium]|nr:MarR family transcriptional regulator [Candidatus Dojkabacteria bacterium]